MPSKSKAQHGFMGKAYSDPKFRKKHKISKETAKEFLDADEGKKFDEALIEDIMKILGDDE